MQETLRITNLGSLKAGDFVNIERAMQMGADVNRRAYFIRSLFIVPQAFHKLSKAKNNRQVWFKLPNKDDEIYPLNKFKGFYCD